MVDYNFCEDLFDTYQSLTPFVQIIWALIPPLFLAALFAIYLQYRLAKQNMKQQIALYDDYLPAPNLPRLSEDLTPEIIKWHDKG